MAIQCPYEKGAQLLALEADWSPIKRAAHGGNTSGVKIKRIRSPIKTADHGGNTKRVKLLKRKGQIKQGESRPRWYHLWSKNFKKNDKNGNKGRHNLILKVHSFRKKEESKVAVVIVKCLRVIV